MLCQIAFESIIKFCEYDLLLIPSTSSMNVEFYSLSNSFYFIILCYIEQKFYVVGPCHHGMARPQVADRGTASDKEGSCE